MSLGIGPTTAGLLTPGLGLGLNSSNGGNLFGLGVGGGTGLTPFVGPNSFMGSVGGSGTGMTPGGGRDANIADLKDFWKAFMRTPGERTPGSVGVLGGGGGESSGSNSGSNNAEKNSNANTGATGTGAGGHRPLAKIASLPDIKTPGGGSAFGHLAAYNNATNNASNANNTNNAKNNDPSTHANFHGSEDLRSYEQAVLARQAPRLTLVPKRRAGSMSVPGGSAGVGKDLTPPHLTSDSNASSPNSNSSGTPAPQQQQQSTTTTGQQPAQISRLIRTDRPSFKRIASSTLGPFESKAIKRSHPPHHLGGENTSSEGDEEAEWAEGVEDVDAQIQAQLDGQAQRGREAKREHVRSPSEEYPAGYEFGGGGLGMGGVGQKRRLSAPSGTAPIGI